MCVWVIVVVSVRLFKSIILLLLFECKIFCVAAHARSAYPRTDISENYKKEHDVVVIQYATDGQIAAFHAMHHNPFLAVLMAAPYAICQRLAPMLRGTMLHRTQIPSILYTYSH